MRARARSLSTLGDGVRQLFFGPDSEGFVELSTLLKDVGDLALGEGRRAGMV